MIRSCSEAICETVGSIMNQHAGKNRHLDPRYFSMEIYLRFNFGPMHLMKDLIKYYLIKIAKVTSEKERLPTNLLLKISTRILLLQTMKKIVKKVTISQLFLEFQLQETLVVISLTIQLYIMSIVIHAYQ